MTTIEELPIPAEYQEASKRFNVIWNDYVDREEDAKSEFIKMINILESSGYTRTKAIGKIVSDHKHLKGFSRMTIYRNLPDDMKRKYENSNIIMLPDNSDVSFDTFENLEKSIIENNNINKPKIQLSKPILNFAKKIELSPNKLKLIDKHHNRLKEHPKLEKKLVKEIAPLTMEEAKIKVNQEIMDLETGATVVDRNSYLIDYNSREKIDKKIQREKQPAEYILEFLEAIENILYLGTGHKLSEDEMHYEPNHIDNTHKHRSNILKDATKNELENLDRNLDALEDMMSHFRDVINDILIHKK